MAVSMTTYLCMYLLCPAPMCSPVMFIINIHGLFAVHLSYLLSKLHHCYVYLGIPSAPTISSSAMIDQIKLLNRSCGRLFTFKDEKEDKKEAEDQDEGWTLSGQCVVVGQRLLVTAAHVCFYYSGKQQKIIPYHLRALFILNDDSQVKLDVYPIRWSGTMDVAVLSVRGCLDKSHNINELRLNPLIPKLSPPDLGSRICFVTYNVASDVEAIRKIQKVHNKEEKIKESMSPHVEASKNSKTKSKRKATKPVSADVEASTKSRTLSLISPSQVPWSRVPSYQDMYNISQILDQSTAVMSYRICYAYYNSNRGDSGAGVLSFDVSEGVFHLLGIHLGAEHQSSKDQVVLNHMDEDSEEKPLPKKSKSDTHTNPHDEPNDNQRVEGSDPDIQQDISTSTNSDISIEAQGGANVDADAAPAYLSHIDHAQTNVARAYFIAAHSIFQRSKWQIDYILTHDSSTHEHNTPPRIPHPDASNLSLSSASFSLSDAGSQSSRSKRVQHNGMQTSNTFPLLFMYDE